MVFLGRTFFSLVNKCKWKYSKENTWLYLHQSKLSSSSSSCSHYFVSTPIFYVNADPHIGHVYSAALADASARFHRLLGNKLVTFSTGTDEHGLKIQQAATLANTDPPSFCDKVYRSFCKALDDCEISYSNFIRTTDRQHKENVQNFWKILEEKGHIYQGKYEGWYCTSDETFLTEEQTRIATLPDGRNQRVSIESGRPVEWFSEENYMFRLSSFREKIIQWLENDRIIQPTKYHNSVKQILEHELPDLSVSRPSARLSWGIPVPNDPTQNIYVWLDALLNYLTVAKTNGSDKTVWPPDVHVIGKDIIKFHAIYWPAFLLAAGLELSKMILVHGHWLVDDEKMSKSTGNVVSPRSCIDHVGVTGLRYFLLHEGVPANDGNFSRKRMVRIVNAELADGLGNLVNRCCGKSLNPAQSRPAVNRSSFELCGTPGVELLQLLERVPSSVYDEYHQWQFYRGIEQVMTLVRAANGVFQTIEPWKLKKTGELEKAQACMAVTMEAARVVGILLQPIIPSFCHRLLDKLGVSLEERSWQFSSVRWSNQDHPLGQQDAVLFPRIKTE